jgi:hypothetical protein
MRATKENIPVHQAIKWVTENCNLTNIKTCTSKWVAYTLLKTLQESIEYSKLLEYRVRELEDFLVSEGYTNEPTLIEPPSNIES